jgi:hypothetical protein
MFTHRSAPFSEPNERETRAPFRTMFAMRWALKSDRRWRNLQRSEVASQRMPVAVGARPVSGSRSGDNPSCHRPFARARPSINERISYRSA